MVKIDDLVKMLVKSGIFKQKSLLLIFIPKNPVNTRVLKTYILIF